MAEPRTKSGGREPLVCNVSCSRGQLFGHGHRFSSHGQLEDSLSRSDVVATLPTPELQAAGFRADAPVSEAPTPRHPVAYWSGVPACKPSRGRGRGVPGLFGIHTGPSAEIKVRALAAARPARPLLGGRHPWWKRTGHLLVITSSSDGSSG
jgi:hypothetical protein